MSPYVPGMTHPDVPNNGSGVGGSGGSGGAGLHGHGNPSDNTVAAGTTYIDDDTANFWAKNSSAWVELITS